jgi:hypothetical protein
MGKVYPEIDSELTTWIGRQHVVFVATAPSGADGHINVSPKGVSNTFVVRGPREVAYLDLFGSGIETIAHLKDNGRIVFMFCAFEGRPRTIRLHGRGEVVEQADMRYPGFRSEFELPEESEAATRAIVRVDVTRIADSCGFTVPLMAFEGERSQLFDTADAWVAKGGPEAIRDYCDINNARSIDGLAALKPFNDEDPSRPRARTARSHEGRAL